MIADILHTFFCLGFTFTSSPGTGKPSKAQQTHTIETLRYNIIIMKFTFQTNHPESGMTTLLFHMMLRWPANVFFWGANPLKSLKDTKGLLPPPWASTVEAHPRVGGAVWPESSHGTLAGFGSKRMEVKLDKKSTAEILKQPLRQIVFLGRGMGQQVLPHN